MAPPCQLIVGFDAQGQGDGLSRPIGAVDDTGDRSANADLARQDGQVERLGSVDLQTLRRNVFREDERQDSHADQIGAMDALEALRDHRLDTQQRHTLGRPVAG
jgi:hypothetical protein